MTDKQITHIIVYISMQCDELYEMDTGSKRYTLRLFCAECGIRHDFFQQKD